MVKVSDTNIRDVTANANLTPSDLDALFLELGMSQVDIENTRYNLRHEAVDIQANGVLQEWRRRNGNGATRQALITALNACRRTEAVEILQNRWRMTNNGISNYFILCLSI